MTKAPLIMICLFAAAALPYAPEPADSTGPDERLRAGEILPAEIHSEEEGAAGRMRILVRAPAQAVWQVVVSCELAFAFVEGLQTCEVLENSGDRAVVHQVVDKGWLLPEYDFIFESLRQPFERIDVRLLEGNLKALDGYWLFRETAEGTLIDYRIHIQPLLPAPRFLVRHSISKGMPDMLACIRGLAGGSGAEDLEKRDLGRCPGKPPGPQPPQ